jgi:ribonuclease HI
MRYMVHLHFPTSNNVAEYEALINALCIAIELGIQRLDIQGNSQLVIDQVMKESSCHNPKMDAYCQVVYKLEDKFDGLELNHIPRWLNEVADTLAKVASGREAVPIGIFTNDQYKPLVCYEDTKQAGDEPPTSDSGAGFDGQQPASNSGADPPSTPSDPKVMEIDEDPVAEPDHLPN